MDALNRLANLFPQNGGAVAPISDLQENLLAILGELPLRGWEALVRGGLSSETVSDFDR